MKKMFDWLREQIENKCNYEPVDYDYCDMACSGEQGFIAREDVLDAINEAEAKWEADCCEWKVLHEKCFIQNPHTKRLFSNEESMQNVYCNTCGKPINIVEVE